MALRVYNTLARAKQEFVPRSPGRVDIYQCGITPYDYTHMGHARQYVFWDTVRRYLRSRGWRVLCVQNVTDVDDKIIARAAERGLQPEEVSEEYHRDFLEVMDLLGVERPDVMPKVTDHIPDIIGLIEGLIDKGHAYQADGDVFFSVESFPGYGRLSGRSVDEMLAGARVEVDPRKRSAMDFALWKSAKPGEPAWDSPWGPGRPGWHIECSALALKYLGNGFDLHGGGDELIFPHHENEIAQSEAYTGEGPFARYFVHHAMLNVGDIKMSKSLGNFFAVRDVLDRFDPGTIRYFFASSHYRSPANYGLEELEASGRAYQRLRSTLDAARRTLAEAEDAASEAAPRDGEADALARTADEARAKFIGGMDDDFNTAVGLAALHDLARAINDFLHSRHSGTGEEREAGYEGLRRAVDAMEELGGILGLFREKGHGCDAGLQERLIELLVGVREDLRSRKEWAAADRIREGLRDVGIVLEDTPTGTLWKRVR